jgi:TorA maturation chaperone TorD
VTAAQPSIAIRPVASPSEEDAARARWYRFLARVFAEAPDAALLVRIGADAASPPDPTPLGRAWAALAAASAGVSADAVAAEHDGLFVGVGRAPIVLHASGWLAGFLNERPLAELRAFLAAAGLARREDAGRTEDHLASLCEVMALLVESDDPALSDRQRELFERFLSPWHGRLAQAVDACEAARWYRPAAALATTFLEVERQAFDFES